jgi:hypothetical protein
MRRSLANCELAADNCFNQAYSRDHTVHAPGEQPQHANGIVSVDRLAEDRLIDHDNRVGSQHQILPPGAPDRECFLARQPLRTLTRRFGYQRSLVDVCRLHGK